VVTQYGLVKKKGNLSKMFHLCMLIWSPEYGGCILENYGLYDVTEPSVKCKAVIMENIYI